MQQDMIVILDLGSEENTRIARDIRGLGVYTEIHAHDITVQELKALPNVKGIILNGGPNRVVDGAAIDVGEAVYGCGLPIFAVDQAGRQKAPQNGRKMNTSAKNCSLISYLESAKLKPTGT